ncbi:hypothetical protein L916_11920 [Phytophthora nicotianae]|uniref:Uncharacterized protein n=1 Tax=Phytophthora nicotianae TaxID=4792 RepID=W2IPL9_PHYNI|nr:hypothetical protein L916_11920 [Phytophthora nicotianae]
MAKEEMSTIQRISTLSKWKVDSIFSRVLDSSVTKSLVDNLSQDTNGHNEMHQGQQVLLEYYGIVAAAHGQGSNEADAAYDRV